MDEKIDELRRQVAVCAASGQISETDMETLKIKANKAGISPSVLEAIIKEDLGDNSELVFHLRWYHVVLSLLIILTLASFVFLGIDFNSNGKLLFKENYSFIKRNNPIHAEDLLQIYSGNFDNKSLLLTIKSVAQDENNTIVAIYDLKCDFLPVVSNAKMTVDIENKKYDFGDNETLNKRVPLGKGNLSRTAAGKIVIKSENNLYQLLQL